jgi:hypothetical protein
VPTYNSTALFTATLDPYYVIFGVPIRVASVPHHSDAFPGLRFISDALIASWSLLWLIILVLMTRFAFIMKEMPARTRMHLASTSQTVSHICFHQGRCIRFGDNGTLIGSGISGYSCSQRMIIDCRILAESIQQTRPALAGLYTIARCQVRTQWMWLVLGNGGMVFLHHHWHNGADKGILIIT